MESLFCNHRVNLFFGCKSLAANIRLSEHNTQQTVTVASKADYPHAVSGKRWLCKAMARNPEWFPDILLRADGYTTKFYKKD